MTALEFDNIKSKIDKADSDILIHKIIDHIGSCKMAYGYNESYDILLNYCYAKIGIKAGN